MGFTTRSNIIRWRRKVAETSYQYAELCSWSKIVAFCQYAYFDIRALVRNSNPKNFDALA